MAITRIMTMMIANRMIRKYMIIMRKEYYNKINYNNKTNDNGYNVFIISWSRHLKCRCFEVLKKTRTGNSYQHINSLPTRLTCSLQQDSNQFIAVNSEKSMESSPIASLCERLYFNAWLFITLMGKGVNSLGVNYFVL